LSIFGKSNPDGSFNWGDALADAAIMAGMTFFATLGGLGVTGLTSDPKATLLAAIISAGSEFFAVLLVKRGLTKKGA